MNASPQTTMVPASALLSAWEEHDWGNGLSLDRLAALDRVLVRTRHSVYEIIVSTPATGDVLVRGGAYFPEFTPARLAGSTLGGSFVKVRALHVGFRLEFTLGREFVLTSAVQSIDKFADSTCT
jgi:hypothetical protein